MRPTELQEIQRFAARGKSLSSVALALEASLLSEDFKEFVKAAWHVVEPNTPMRWGWALDAICDHLTAVTEGRILRLLVNVPPGMMKSLLVNVMWPAWEWTNPARRHLRYLGTAHKQDLAVRDNMKCRRLIQSEWYQRRWDVKLTSDQNAKCLVAGTPVTMADGTLKPVERVQPGDRVLSYDLTSGRLVEDTVKHAWSNGVKPVRRIKLSDGTEVTATLNHRFYGWEDWLYVEHMRTGDALSVLHTTPAQEGALSADDAFLLALWLSEGSKTNSAYMFASADPLIVQRVRRIARQRGWRVKQYGDYGYSVTAERNVQHGTPQALLKKHLGEVFTAGSRSKRAAVFVDTIRVPDAVFAATDSVVLEFLGAYIACDGAVVNAANHGLCISSASERMIRDLALLFKRFGVYSSVRSTPAWATHKDGTRKMGRTAWRLSIMGAEEVLKLRDLNVFSKNEKFAGLLEHCEASTFRGGRNATVPPQALKLSRPMWARRSLAQDYARKRRDAELERKVSGPLDWRRIVAVEDAGEQETFHLETERTHLFFAEGILSHNTKFENSTTGFREAMAFTSMTGSRGDRVLLDDPLSVDNANSEADLEAAKTTFLEALPTRVNNEDSAIIIIMQRLAEGDTSGIILERKLPYEHLMLPMEFEPSRRCSTSIGFKDPRTKDGELLFPERFSAKQVTELKAQLGSYATAGQLQQRPTPRGGGMFKDHFLGLWPAAQKIPDLLYILQSYDTAYTEDVINDPSAHTTWGVFRHPTRGVNCVLLLDSWDEHLSYTKLRQRVINDWKAEYGGEARNKRGSDPARPPRRADECLIEVKGSGISLIQELNNAGIPARSYNPGKADKVARAYMIQPLYESRLVYVLESAKEPGKPVEWARPFTEQLSKFGPAVLMHDDYVDTLTQALIRLRDIKLLELPRYEEEVKEAVYKKPAPNPYD